MVKTTNIPRTDAAFDDTQERITNIAIPSASTFGLNALWINNDLSPAKERWVKAWAAYVLKDTRTPLITAEKTESREEYQPLISQLITMLTVSPTVTKADLDAMGIHTRDPHPTPSPVPETYVEVNFTATLHRIIAHFFDESTIDIGSGKKRAKPPGVHGCEFKWGVLPTRPAFIDDLPHSSFATRTPFVFDFPLDYSGRILYLAVRWENTRGQKGPWSKIYECAIP
jgi:hypothetical protein